MFRGGGGLTLGVYLGVGGGACPSSAIVSQSEIEFPVEWEFFTVFCERNVLGEMTQKSSSFLGRAVSKISKWAKCLV